MFFVMLEKDEKRMDRLKRRLDELELVQNNVKLMNELLSHYKPESGLEEKQLLEVSREVFVLESVLSKFLYLVIHVELAHIIIWAWDL